MVSTHSWPTVPVHSSSMVDQDTLHQWQTDFHYWLRSVQRNLSDCIILDSTESFDNFISFDELFIKTLQRLRTCLLVNYKYYGKLGLSTPIMSGDSLKATPDVFFCCRL